MIAVNHDYHPQNKAGTIMIVMKNVHYIHVYTLFRGTNVMTPYRAFKQICVYVKCVVYPGTNKNTLPIKVEALRFTILP